MGNDSSLTHKAALITGASSGIGYELTQLLARDGCDLVLVARDAALLGQIAQDRRRDFSISATVIAKDLATATAAEEIYAELQSTGIEIDIRYFVHGIALTGVKG